MVGGRTVWQLLAFHCPSDCAFCVVLLHTLLPLPCIHSTHSTPCRRAAFVQAGSTSTGQCRPWACCWPWLASSWPWRPSTCPGATCHQRRARRPTSCTTHTVCWASSSWHCVSCRCVVVLGVFGCRMMSGIGGGSRRRCALYVWVGGLTASSSSRPGELAVLLCCDLDFY